MRRPDPTPLLEIRQSWHDTCLEVRHFAPSARPVTVGGGHAADATILGLRRARLPAALAGFLPEGLPGPLAGLATPTSDLHVPESAVPHGEDRAFARFEDGAWVVAVEPGWTVRATRDDAALDLDGLLAQGRAEASGTLHRVPVDDGTTLEVDLGPTTLTLRAVARETVRRPGWIAGAGGLVATEALLLGLLGLFGFVGMISAVLVAMLPGSPDVSGYTVDDRFTHLLASVEKPVDAPKDAPSATNRPDGRAAKRAEGKSGRPDSRQDVARGERAAADRQRADREVAENAGALGALRDGGGMEGTAIGADLLAGIGGVIGAKGVQRGTGLGSRGRGLGGGNDVDGIGGVGTGGVGGGDGRYGRSGGNFGDKTEGTFTAAIGDPVTIGGLDRAQVDAVVKQHLSQLRYCYQRQLQRDPSLGGKVSIRFTIAGDGTVSSARVGASQLGDAAVEDCLVGRFLRMRFPEPRGGGVVLVTYPFVFSPG